MDSEATQQVLVIETSLLARLGSFEGYTLDVDRYLPHLLDPSNTRLLPRAQAEEDVQYKQLIPYVIMRYGDRVFHYVRGNQSNETRLVGKRSIGIGGHIDGRDRLSTSLDRRFYLEAARREVREEVILESPYSESIVALLNDNASHVGQVHLGILHLWDLEEPRVRARESLIAGSGFKALTELARARDELETWSQLALRVLERRGRHDSNSRGGVTLSRNEDIIDQANVIHPDGSEKHGSAGYLHERF